MRKYYNLNLFWVPIALGAYIGVREALILLSKKLCYMPTLNIKKKGCRQVGTTTITSTSTTNEVFVDNLQ